MISMFSFLHTCFMRSYRYGPPTFVFILGIFFVYSVVPNPVMESYAFSTSFLFVVACVLCYTIIDLETPSQEAVTMIHSGSLYRLYLSKLLYSWIFTIPLALYAVLFPAIFHKFYRNPSFEELFMSLLYHLSISWLAVSLTCWFSSKFIRSRVTSFLMLSLLVVITFSATPLENLLPERLKYAILLFPPLNKTLNVLSDYDDTAFIVKISAIGASLLYGIMIGALFLFVLNKRKLDSP